MEQILLEFSLYSDIIGVIKEFLNYPHAGSSLSITKENKSKYIIDEEYVIISVDKLYIDVGGIRRLKVIGFVNELHCSNVGGSLDYIACPEVKFIRCCNNYRLRYLYCPKVEKIWCYGNNLRKLNCPVARYIHCARNNIISLNCPLAREVLCSDNQLEKLVCPRAKFVLCSHNKIKELECPKVKRIECQNNELDSIDFPRAQFVNCSHNKLRYANFVSCYELICNGRLPELLHAPHARII